MNILSQLQPTAGDPDSISDAIAKAEKARDKATVFVDSLERQMRSALVDASDSELDRLEREADLAHRGVERIEALLEQMRSALPVNFIRLNPPPATE